MWLNKYHPFLYNILVEEAKTNKVINNIAWRFAEKFCCQIISFVVSTIIARMMDPDSYGVVAIVNTYIQLLSVFIDVGFGSYIIRNKNADDLDYSTAFFANLILCAVLYIVLFVCIQK